MNRSVVAWSGHTPFPKIDGTLNGPARVEAAPFHEKGQLATGLMLEFGLFFPLRDDVHILP